MVSSKPLMAILCATAASLGVLLGTTVDAAAQLEKLFPFLAPSPPAAAPAAGAPTAAPSAAGSVAAPAVTGSVPSGPPEWSGQPGSSGHPLMTTEAILSAAANFGTCLEGLWPDAARRGVTRATFDTYTRGLTPDLRIMDLVDAQPEFTKAFWDYLDLLVSDNRIKRGHEVLAQHRAIFDAMEKAYGVDRNIVVAIWGIESNFGTQGGDRPVVRSTATLACV